MSVISFYTIQYILTMCIVLLLLIYYYFEQMGIYYLMGR